MCRRCCFSLLVGLAAWAALGEGALAQPADLILHHGKVVTVDADFTIAEAVAVRGERILRVGSNEEVLKTRGGDTKLIDLGGRMVIPGLIDSHTHPAGAAMTEFDHPIPTMETIPEVLDYIRSRAEVLDDGQWIHVRQVFITRLREQRYPTREELDQAAPNNPVLFATGPDASANSLALERSGIDRDFEVDDGGPGYIEKDPETGEPTGILRSCTRYVKVESPGRQPTESDRVERLLALFKDYNSVGITSICDRSTSPNSIPLYETLRDRGDLTVRLALSHHVGTTGDLGKIQETIRKIAAHRLRRDDPMLRIIGIKTFLDGGMLTGSAYMREPWGVSKIYSIEDPEYRGLRFIPEERLVALVRTTVETGMQFTAHSVGDGAVHALLDAYREVNKTLPIRETRPTITHSNFMSREAVEAMVELGVGADIQPAWLYLDTRTLTAQFGYDRLRYFQPLHTIFELGALAGGGTDHMQKIGSLRSVNPYNPFLGMWVTVTRRAKGYDRPLHPEEAITRAQALRFYTMNNAYLLFQEKRTGSLEPGKLADLVVLDTDLLACPIDAIRKTQVDSTYLGGELIYERAR